MNCNSLYASAMCEPMPMKSFKWLNQLEIESFQLQNIKSDSKRVTFLKQIQFPNELHDMHNDYPMCAEHLDITGDMLSTYQDSTLKEL